MSETKKELWRKLNAQVDALVKTLPKGMAWPGHGRLYLSRVERDFYVSLIGGYNRSKYSVKPRVSLVHPLYKGMRIYLEKP